MSEALCKDGAVEEADTLKLAGHLEGVGHSGVGKGTLRRRDN